MPSDFSVQSQPIFSLIITASRLPSYHDSHHMLSAVLPTSAPLSILLVIHRFLVAWVRVLVSNRTVLQEALCPIRSRRHDAKGGKKRQSSPFGAPPHPHRFCRVTPFYRIIPAICPFQQSVSTNQFCRLDWKCHHASASLKKPSKIRLSRMSKTSKWYKMNKKK